ncbi:hypothetical protein ACET3Z_001245 [Daucus carota]
MIHRLKRYNGGEKSPYRPFVGSSKTYLIKENRGESFRCTKTMGCGNRIRKASTFQHQGITSTSEFFDFKVVQTNRFNNFNW